MQGFAGPGRAAVGRSFRPQGSCVRVPRFVSDASGAGIYQRSSISVVWGLLALQPLRGLCCVLSQPVRPPFCIAARALDGGDRQNSLEGTEKDNQEHLTVVRVRQVVTQARGVLRLRSAHARFLRAAFREACENREERAEAVSLHDAANARMGSCIGSESACDSARQGQVSCTLRTSFLPAVRTHAEEELPTAALQGRLATLRHRTDSMAAEEACEARHEELPENLSSRLKNRGRDALARLTGTRRVQSFLAATVGQTAMAGVGLPWHRQQHSFEGVAGADEKEPIQRSQSIVAVGGEEELCTPVALGREGRARFASGKEVSYPRKAVRGDAASIHLPCLRLAPQAGASFVVTVHGVQFAERKCILRRKQRKLRVFVEARERVRVEIAVAHWIEHDSECLRVHAAHNAGFASGASTRYYQAQLPGAVAQVVANNRPVAL
eukprot:scaffold368_cov258-Pinguiococcus_pyrenoidosus.AAC.6